MRYIPTNNIAMLDPWIAKVFNIDIGNTILPYIISGQPKSDPGYPPISLGEYNRVAAQYNNIERDFAIDSLLHFQIALSLISKTKVGKRLLELIEINAGRIGKIKLHFNKNGRFGVKKPNSFKNGMKFSPELHLDFTALDKAYNDPHGYLEGINKALGYSIIVFHELTHVYHSLIGTAIDIPLSPDYQGHLHGNMIEEARTVGLGEFRTEEISENKYREELGLPRKKTYQFRNSILNDRNRIQVVEEFLDKSGYHFKTVPFKYPPRRK